MDRDLLRRPRILIAMIEAGGGHRAPALAVRAALERNFPGRFEIDVLDIMRHLGDERLDRRHKESWKWMLAHPHVTFALQSVVDHVVPVPWTRWAQRRALTTFSRHLATFVREQHYALLVGLHFMPLHAAVMARRRGGLELPIVGIDTDPFDGHALWVIPEIDELIVASVQARSLLVAKGMAADRIHIFGYPLGLEFLDVDGDSDVVRRKLGLELGRLTVVHTVGGEGIGGDVEGAVAAILRADLDLQYVVIAGRNERLRARLQALVDDHRSATRTRLRIEGFTSAMPEWIAASDLVVGKAGAASTLEALALGKPIFHTSYVAPNEKRNLDYCREHGIGGYLPRPQDIVELLAPLCRDIRPVRAWQAHVAALAMAPGTLAIADHLASLVERP